MRRIWLRWLLWSVCRLRQVGHALAAASLRRARGQGAALEAWMRVAAQRAVEARGALHWATRGRGARERAVRRLLTTWRHVARALRRARVQLHLAARYRKHRVQFAAFVALG